MNYEIRDGLTLPVWESFDAAHALAELSKLYDNGRAFAERIAAMESPTFADIIADEDNDNDIARVAGPLQHLFSTMKEKYPDLKGAMDAANELGVQYGADISFDKGLYEAYKKVRAREDFMSLTAEQQCIVQRAIEGFERAGIALPKEAQDELRKINQELTRLSTTFSDNVTKATDAWSLLIPECDAHRLRGIPEAAQEAMRRAAQKKGQVGALVALGMSDTLAVLEYAHDRDLRQEVWTARNARASSLSFALPEVDNGPLMPRMLQLRQRKAEILGFSSFNELSLSKKAARSVGVAGVDDFLCTIALAAQSSAKEDFARWQERSKDHRITRMQPWDIPYLSRIIKEEKFDIDDEKVREYFPLQNVLATLSDILENWWGVTLAPIMDASVWHDSVTLYAVKNKDGATVAALYMDLFERNGKNGGAWMDDAVARRETSDGVQLPVAHLIGNFRKPADSDAYLSHDEMVTLFHEAGHCFHLLMTEAKYLSTNMTSVEWDTIELPSQFFENWCWEKDTLQYMSAHRITGEPIPDDLLDALIGQRYFESGSMAVRQVLQALFDWDAHKYVPASEQDLLAMYAALSEEIVLRPVRPEVRFPHAFSHIFAGGYAAGYFSYLWAEGLVADVYAAFAEEGGMMNAEVAERYRKEILAPGASRPMMESFRAFRGRDLDATKLIPYLGLAT